MGAESQEVLRALILSGGGARGAYEAGVVAEMADHGVRFDIVSGTSIGAINGFAVAQGQAQQLEQLWTDVPTSPQELGQYKEIAPFREEVAWIFAVFGAARRIIDTALKVIGKGRPPAQVEPQSTVSYSFFDRLKTFKGVFKISHLHEVLGLIDERPRDWIIRNKARFDVLKQGTCTLIVGVTDLTASRGACFAYFPDDCASRQVAFLKNQEFQNESGQVERTAELIDEGNYHRAIAASAALPPAFAPVQIPWSDKQVHYFVDGAFTCNTPLNLAIDAGATQIVAIELGPVRASSTGKPRHLPHVVRLALEANTNEMLELQRRAVEEINQDLEEKPSPGKRHIEMFWVAPNDEITLDPLNFTDRKAIGDLIKRGRDDAHKFLADNPSLTAR